MYLESAESKLLNCRSLGNVVEPLYCQSVGNVIELPYCESLDDGGELSCVTSLDNVAKLPKRETLDGVVEVPYPKSLDNGDAPLLFKSNNDAKLLYLGSLDNPWVWMIPARRMDIIKWDDQILVLLQLQQVS